MTDVVARYLGRLPFLAGLEQQRSTLMQLERSQNRAIVLGLEHSPVITLGVRGQLERDLQFTKLEIQKRGFEIHKTDRGGQATLHNLGQLVIYPICDIQRLNLGARDFVCLIEKTTGAWLTSMGVDWSRQVNEPGIFANGSKLVALGFKISRGKTSHGLAINAFNNLNDFELIRTCGVQGQSMTSLEKLGIDVNKRGGLGGLFQAWVAEFERQMQQLDAEKTCQIDKD